MPARSFYFGPFKFLADQQRLLRYDEPVRLGSRAIAILSVLIEHAGELVTKQDLISRVWPDTFVDESNLKVNIAALRKAIDEDDGELSHIVNISGRGYRFVTPVSIGNPGNLPESQHRSSNLPHPMMKQVVGRCQAIQHITAELSQCRSLTIVGSAGVGKTTVATAVAESAAEKYRDGVSFVDFSPLNDSGMVTHVICAALRLPVTVGNVKKVLLSYLYNRELLLVFDSCEHVLTAAADCAEMILSFCPKVNILATSREPLRAKGERSYRLPPLDVPPEHVALTSDMCRSFPAVQLFLKRATETFGELTIDDSQALTIAELCRQLDGVPLAIELAAVCVRLLGFEGLRTVANDHFLQFRQGRRTGPPRHETLEAAYEWSFDSLPENERSALARLSILNSSFDFDTAVSVASGGSMSIAETTACIANLVAKSLIEHLDPGASKFRLLHLVRYFASRMLVSRGDIVERAPDRLRLAPSQWAPPFPESAKLSNKSANRPGGVRTCSSVASVELLSA